MRKLFEKRNKRTSSSEFVLYRNVNLGFSFKHPKGWHKKTNDVITVFPSDAIIVSVPNETIASPCITMLVSGGKSIENLSQFYKSYLLEQRKHYEKYKLLWDHPARLISGESAHEWSFEFNVSTFRFTAAYVMATKNIGSRNATFLLNGACRKPQFKGLEPTFLKVVRSLSLS